MATGFILTTWSRSDREALQQAGVAGDAFKQGYGKSLWLIARQTRKGFQGLLYNVFRGSATDLKAYVQKRKTTPSLYEVCWSGYDEAHKLSQRVVFDIELEPANPARWASLWGTYDNAVAMYRDEGMPSFLQMHLRARLAAVVPMLHLETVQMWASDSTGAPETKISFHIATNLVAKDHAEAAWLAGEMGQPLDESIYGKRRLMRLPLCTKFGENRPLRLTEGWFKDFLMTNVAGCIPLPALDVSAHEEVATARSAMVEIDVELETLMRYVRECLEDGTSPLYKKCKNITHDEYRKEGGLPYPVWRDYLAYAAKAAGIDAAAFIRDVVPLYRNHAQYGRAKWETDFASLHPKQDTYGTLYWLASAHPEYAATIASSPKAKVPPMEMAAHEWAVVALESRMLYNTGEDAARVELTGHGCIMPEMAIGVQCEDCKASNIKGLQLMLQGTTLWVRHGTCKRQRHTDYTDEAQLRWELTDILVQHFLEKRTASAEAWDKARRTIRTYLLRALGRKWDDLRAFMYDPTTRALGKCIVGHYKDLPVHTTVAGHWYFYDGHGLWVRTHDDRLVCGKVADDLGPAIAAFRRSEVARLDALVEEARIVYDELVEDTTAKQAERMQALHNLREMEGERDARKKVLRQAQRFFDTFNSRRHGCQEAFHAMLSDTIEKKMDSVSYLLPIEHTGKTRAARPSDYVMKCITLRPNTDSANYVEQFFGLIFDGDTALTQYMQKVLGYCLTGDVSEQDFYCMYGTQGANGKDTLLNILRAVMGRFFTMAKPRLMCTDKAASSHEAEMACLDGTRLVAISEVGPNAKFNGERAKRLTGSAFVTWRDVGEKDRETRMTAKLLMGVNTLPALADTHDDALQRRFVPLPFPVTFNPKYRGKPCFREPKPQRELEAEIETALPSFLQWMIDGAVRYYAEGMGEKPPCVEALMAEYWAEQDQVQQFLDERCVLGAGNDPKHPPAMSTSDLYAEFRHFFARVTGDKVPPMKDFKAALLAKGLVFKHTRVGDRWMGIAMKQEEPMTGIL